MARAHLSTSSWQRQRGEPARAHALFSSYLALGPGHSLSDLARSGTASLSYLKKLSARWHWRERAASWQAQLVSGLPTQPEQVAATRERQLKDALAMQQLAKAQISHWLGRDREGTVRLLRQFTPHQMMRFWQVGFLVEDGLLPLPEPVRPQEVRHALLAQSREREASPAPSPRTLSLPRAFAAFEEAMRVAGIRVAKRRALLSLTRRWLWLPEEKAAPVPSRLSLPPPKKARGSRSQRGRRQVRDES
jgi:hypothetical protein